MGQGAGKGQIKGLGDDASGLIEEDHEWLADLLSAAARYFPCSAI